MSDELKPCPACGKGAAINSETTVRPHAYCDNPDCFMYCVGFHVEEWNKPRPAEDALRAALQAVRIKDHHVDEWDSYHSCYKSPMHPDHDDPDLPCVCGKDENNRIIDEVLKPPP